MCIYVKISNNPIGLVWFPKWHVEDLDITDFKYHWRILGGGGGATTSEIGAPVWKVLDLPLIFMQFSAKFLQNNT